MRGRAPHLSASEGGEKSSTACFEVRMFFAWRKTVAQFLPNAT
jgi:hypothetical protein